MNNSIETKIERVNNLIKKNNELGYVSRKLDMQCMAKIIIAAPSIFKVCYDFEKVITKSGAMSTQSAMRDKIYDATNGCFYEVSDFEDDFWMGEKFGDYESSWNTLLNLADTLQRFYSSCSYC